LPVWASFEQKEVDVKNFLVGLGLMVVGASAFAGTQAVPEPDTLLLVALAAVVGLVARRGKKK
jgi:hypothetical protein